MATGDQPIAKDDTLEQLLASLKDQKSTSTTSSNISSTGVNSIIQQILSSSQGLGAVASGAHVSGGYNSTVQQQQLNDLITRTAGEVAQKQAGTTTVTAKKAPVSIGNILTTIGASGASKLLAPTFKTLEKKLGIDGLGDKLNSAVFGNSTGAGAGAATDSTAGVINGSAGGLDSGASVASSLGGFDTTDTVASDSGASLESLFSSSSSDAALNGTSEAASAGSGASASDLITGNAAAASAGAGAGAAAETAGLSDMAASAAAADAGYSAAAEGGADLASEGVLADLGPYGMAAAAALYLGTQYGPQIDDNVIQPVGDAIGDVGSAISDGLGDLGNTISKGAGWIVCTELVKQNRMPKRFYIAGLRRFNSYDARGKQGYYYWAVNAVLHLRRNPTSRYSKFLCWVMNHRAEYIAAFTGVPSARRTITGAFAYYGLYAFCWTLSRTLARNPIEWHQPIYGDSNGN
jgi:hypothetical protein